MRTRKIYARKLSYYNGSYRIRLPKKHLDALGLHEGSYLRFWSLKDKLVASPLLAGIFPNMVEDEVPKNIVMCERKGRQDIIFNLRERVRKEAQYGAEALSVFSDIISKDPLPDEQFTSGKMRVDRASTKDVVRRIGSTSMVSIPGELMRSLKWHPEDSLDLSVVEGTLVISQKLNESSSHHILYSSKAPNNNQIIGGDAIARATAN